MNNQKVKEKVSQIVSKASEKINADELKTEIEQIFTIDSVTMINEYINVNATYEHHLFTYDEIKRLFELSLKYDFEFSVHEKNNYNEYLNIHICFGNSENIIF